MPLTLEQAIARVPQWTGAIDLKATPLGGGITNNNYRIDVHGESFVLRIAGEDTELLGIDRKNEFAAHLAAGGLGIAPEVFYFIQPEGYLVTRFVKGRMVPPEEMRQPENIRRVMETVRRIHRMSDIPGCFDVFEAVRGYVNTARRYKVSLPDRYDWLSKKVKEAEEVLTYNPRRLCPCHDDLLNANFLATDRQLYILDWEYAGMGDLFFDLANFSDHHSLSDEQDRWLLECYFEEEVTPDRWAHLKIMKVMSELREATWSLVQVGISKLDFDFREYADRFFGSVFVNIQNPNWNEWLKEASKYV